ncbi:hypothetical protein, partial [Vibrio rarus]
MKRCFINNKCCSFILNFFICMSIVFTHNALAKGKNYADQSKALGFIIGQQYTLNRIKTEYPQLTSQVSIAEIEFHRSFGLAERNLKNELKAKLADYPSYINRVRSEAYPILKLQKLSYEIANQFIHEVRVRSQGKIESSILNTLLAYQYKDNPEIEFIRGFKDIYRTKGHAKSKGLDVQIEYPKSWSIQEGKRPNIIKYFNNNNGNGLVSAVIMTRDFLKGMQGALTKHEVKKIKTKKGSRELASEIFSKNTVSEMTQGMNNVRDLKSKRIVMDGWPAAMIEFIGENKRLDVTMTVYTRMY